MATLDMEKIKKIADSFGQKDLVQEIGQFAKQNEDMLSQLGEKALDFLLAGLFGQERKARKIYLENWRELQGISPKDLLTAASANIKQAEKREKESANNLLSDLTDLFGVFLGKILQP